MCWLSHYANHAIQTYHLTLGWYLPSRHWVLVFMAANFGKWNPEGVHTTEFPAALGLLLGTVALSPGLASPCQAYMYLKEALGVSLSLAHLMASTIKLLLFHKSIRINWHFDKQPTPEQFMIHGSDLHVPRELADGAKHNPIRAQISMWCGCLLRRWDSPASLICRPSSQATLTSPQTYSSIVTHDTHDHYFFLFRMTQDE